MSLLLYSRFIYSYMTRKYVFLPKREIIKMLDKTKLKMRDRNVYWRESKEGVYKAKHPEMQVREATLGFLSKKQALTEAQKGRESELLEVLIDNIRDILACEGTDQTNAKRRARK